MGIYTSIQKFVDDLDMHSTSYLLLLVFQAVLIATTFFVKQKVYDFDYTLRAPVFFTESTQPDPPNDLSGSFLKLFH